MPLTELSRRAEALESTGNWVEAASVWKELVARDSDVSSVVRAALALSKANQLDAAEQMLQSYRHTHSDSPRFLVALGMVEKQLGKLEAARVSLEAALSIEEQSFVLTILGWIQQRLGRPEAAEQAYLRALHLDPNDDEAHLGLAQTLAKKDPDAAIAHIRKAIDAEPHDGSLYSEFAQLLWRAGKTEEAEQAARRAIELDPQNLGHMTSSGTWQFCETTGWQLRVSSDWPSLSTLMSPCFGVIWLMLQRMSGFGKRRSDIS